MARDLVRAAGFWAFPTALIVVWLAVAGFSLSQLASVAPSLSAPISRPIQDRAREPVPRSCLDAC